MFIEKFGNVAPSDLEKAKQSTEMVTNMLNSSIFNKKLFCHIMATREHRYLQSEFFELCLKWIETVASDDYPMDGRNEWCHTYAKEIQKLIEEKF